MLQKYATGQMMGETGTNCINSMQLCGGGRTIEDTKTLTGTPDQGSFVDTAQADLNRQIFFA